MTRTPIVEDGTKILFIPITGSRRIPIVQAFAIGDHAVTGDGIDVFDWDGHRDVTNWGRINITAEGQRWCRGWDGEAAKALRAAAALALKDDQILYDHVQR